MQSAYSAILYKTEKVSFLPRWVLKCTCFFNMFYCQSNGQCESLNSYNNLSNLCRKMLKRDEWKVSLFLRRELNKHILTWPVIRVYLNGTYSVRLCATWQSCGCTAHKPPPPMSSSQAESGCSKPKGRDKQPERD